MLKKKERSYIKYLNDREVPISEIARRTKRSRPSVRRAIKEPVDKEYERSAMESQVDKYLYDVNDSWNP